MLPLRSKPSLICIMALITLVFSLAFPVNVLADDPLPPPEEPSALTEPPVETGELAQPEADGETADVETAPVQDEAPTADTPLADEAAALSEAGMVLVNPEGEVLPLVTQEAAEILTAADPYIVRGGTTYRFLPVGGCAAYGGVGPTCTESATPIQTAINFSSSGEVINIEPGTYVEQLVIDGKDITLQATGAGVTLQAPNDIANCYTSSQQNQAIVCVRNTTNTSIVGMTVDGLNGGNNDYRYTGVGFFNAGGTIQGNTIQHITDTPFSGSQHGTGIMVYNADGTPRTIDIVDNTIFDYQKNGMVVSGNNLTAYVNGNTVTGIGETPITAQNGIQISFGATGVVENNTVSDNYYNNAGMISGSGILVYQPGDGVVVRNNTLNGNAVGVQAEDADNLTIEGNTMDQNHDGISLNNDNNNIIRDNLIQNSINDGIGIWGGSNNLVDGNTVSGSGNAGIMVSGAWYYDWSTSQWTYVGPADHVDIVNNQLLNNGYGIYVDDADLETSRANNNSIIGNGIGVSNIVEGDFDATGNYWGCPGGPDDPACDSVTTFVLYDPFANQNPFVAPVKGGKTQLTGSSECVSPSSLMEQGIEVGFYGLCGYTAELDVFAEENLPGALPAGTKYTAGIKVDVLENGDSQTTLPSSGSLLIKFPIPAGMEGGTFVILFWDAANNQWVEVPSTVVDGFVQATVTSPGIYVLATK